MKHCPGLSVKKISDVLMTFNSEDKKGVSRFTCGLKFMIKT